MEDPKQKVKDYNKNYYETNKAKLSNVAREKVQCTICNKKVARDYVKKHQKTKQCCKPTITKQLEIHELNEFIDRMNEKYNTNVQKFVVNQE